jgi:hypothetical protein
MLGARRMRAVPIPDAFVWPGAVRKVIAGGPGGRPDGFDETGRIAPCEALIDVDDLGPRFSMLVELEPGELEKLQREPRFWLVIHSPVLVPFGFVLEADR